MAVVEREIAGFGPSGRNGGWASAGIAGNAQRYARLRGDDAVRRGERAMAAAVGEIGDVVAAEAIDCGWRHTGTLMVATSAPQVARLHEGIARRRAFGIGEDDLRLLEPAELEARVRVAGARAASFTPHCGRVDPARLARGLAVACERLGVTSRAHRGRGDRARGRVVCAGGVLRAASVLRVTEAFTVQQPGERRRFMPLYSLMVATEPLPAAVWDEIGWVAARPSPICATSSSTPSALQMTASRLAGAARRTASAPRSTRPTSATTPCAPAWCAPSPSAFPPSPRR